MASLHTNNQEISGRQVWTGSISLAHTLLHLSDSEKRNIFDNRRYLIFDNPKKLFDLLHHSHLQLYLLPSLKDS